MMVCVDSQSASVLACNQTTATKWGYTKEEVNGKKIFGLYHPDFMKDVEKCESTFDAQGNSLVSIGTVQDIITTYQLSDGKTQKA
jgi:PAS domain S-box-containing protein